MYSTLFNKLTSDYKELSSVYIIGVGDYMYNKKLDVVMTVVCSLEDAVIMVASYGTIHIVCVEPIIVNGRSV